MDSPLLPNHSNPVLGASKHASDGLFRRHWRGELASGEKKKHTPREARGKNTVLSRDTWWERPSLGKTPREAQRKNAFWENKKNVAFEGFSDRPGLGKNKETPREARETNMSFAINSSWEFTDFRLVQGVGRFGTFCLDAATVKQI